MSSRLPRQAGYTLIELLLAMSIFSFMLLLILSGYLSVFRLYQNGLASRDTQQNGRYAMEEMVRTVRESKDVVGAVTSGDFDSVCLQSQSGAMSKLTTVVAGSFRKLMIIVNPNPLAFDLANCTSLSPTTVGASSQELTSTKVEVVSFKPQIIPAPSATGYKGVKLALKIGTHTSDLVETLSSGQKSCTSASGSQFCAITAYESSATVRGKDQQ